MSTPSHRTFTNAAVILGAGLFALAGVALIPPLRNLERQMVKALAVTVDPVDTILDGNGSQDHPWVRRRAVPPVVPPQPRLLNIDDDPEGYFSASPLAPIDHALIFARLHEAGHQVLGVGHLMAWDETEPLAMDALRKQLDRFDAAVLALPLARGAVPEPVAAPLLRWSLQQSEARGKVSTLPQVNRIAIPNSELGGGKTLAGFSLLENEEDPGDGVQPLLARWGDRIVFAFPLALEIAAEGLTPADVMIHVGKEIRLGESGPVIEIDEFGRGAVAPGVEAIEAPAKRLISEGPESPKSKPLLTRDTRTGLAAADKAWSDRLPGRVQALRTAPRFEPAVTLPRPDALLELLLVSVLAFFATWATRLQRRGWRVAAAVLVTGLGAQLLYLLAARQNAWLPPLAMLCPGLIAFGLSLLKEESSEFAEPADTVAPPREIHTPTPAVTTTPAEENLAKEVPPEDTPVSDEPVPARRTARKTASKAATTTTPTSARKAAKTAPAKKAARKAARKPPTGDPDTASHQPETSPSHEPPAPD